MACCIHAMHYNSPGKGEPVHQGALGVSKDLGSGINRVPETAHHPPLLIYYKTAAHSKKNTPFLTCQRASSHECIIPRI